MLYPEGLMHRKVNIGLALLVIFVIAGIFAWIISARAVLLPGIAIRVISPAIPCITNTDITAPSGICTNTCQTCGTLAFVCNGMFEVKAIYWGGTNLLMLGAGGPALCLPASTGGIPPIAAPNPVFTPGSFCLGNIFFTPIGHILSNFGCSF